MDSNGKFEAQKLCLCLILTISLMLASCASTGGPDKKQAQSLAASVDLFNSSFRWEDYKAAASFVPVDRREAFWSEVDKFKDKIRLTEYEIREVEFLGKGPQASAIVRFQFWRLESPLLENASFTQKWLYNEKDKHWRVIDSGFGAITKSPVGF